MAEIHIQRKKRVVWWPWLLLLVLPLAWTLVMTRRSRATRGAGPVRDTATPPAMSPPLQTGPASTTPPPRSP